MNFGAKIQIFQKDNGAVLLHDVLLEDKVGCLIFLQTSSVELVLTEILPVLLHIIIQIRTLNVGGKVLKDKLALNI